MDLWRLEVAAPRRHDRGRADHVLGAMGVTVGWTDRPGSAGADVAGIDLAFRLDPPAVVAALRAAGVDVVDLRRLEVAGATGRAGDRRIA